jgi:hypothetical protein
MSANGSSKKAEDLKNQLTQTLDKLENATDAALAVVSDIPTDSGAAKLVTSAGSNFYVYLDQNGSGAIAKIGSDGSIASTTPVKGISPSAMFSSDAYVAVVDANAKNLASLSISKSSVISKSFSSDPLVNLEVYQDNLYGLTATGIVKITDAALGKTDVQPWLASGATLAPGASLITVDGNVYTLSSDGTLTTYYKGKKTADVKTAVSPGAGSMLLSNSKSSNLYLVNVSTGRIYIFDKSSGAVSKTLKINSSQPISGATLSADGDIYILSGNKIWSVK